MLHNLFETKNIARTLLLLNKLHIFRMEEGSPIEEFVWSVKDIIMPLKIGGKIINEKTILHVMLNALPTNYEGFIQSIIGQE